MASVGSEKGVVLQKIGENTYTGKSGDVEQFLFCPHCEETFISSEMKEAYKEHVKLMAGIKVEKALKEAFGKEFSEEESKFTKITRRVNFSMYILLTVFAAFVLIFVLGFGSEKYLDLALWVTVGGECVLGIGNLVYISNFARKKSNFLKNLR